MKKSITVMIVGVFFIGILSVGAQIMGSDKGMMMKSDTVASSQAVDEEAQGKAIWDKLQLKQIICAELKDDDFDLLGEYFMGRMLGDQHELMNVAIKQKMGDDSEKQMHISIGKRMSGCDVNAILPGGGIMGMMQMGNSNFERVNNMMGVHGPQTSVLSWLTLLLIWTFLILGILFFVRRLRG